MRRLGPACSPMFLLLFVLQAALADGAGRDTIQNAVKGLQEGAPTVRIVFFTPSDLAMPDGARERLTKIVDATEKTFFTGMNRWGYPPTSKSLFRCEPDGLVEVLNVQGDLPLSSGKYAKPGYAKDVIQRASEQYHVTVEGQVWWIFIYLGDGRHLFSDYRGTGNPRDGGWAMVNYDKMPGEIRPDLGLVDGFNGEFFLKGTIHELGHAFGLPHVGPDLSLGLGNSLMGPTTAAYARRKYLKADQIYLTESSAAMLWMHPVFSGTAMGRAHLPSVRLTDYKPVFDQTNDAVTISGKLIADQPAHSVVLIDGQGRPRDQYWVQSHAVRISHDGTFQIKINKPAKVNGHYRILFCFDNGLVTGDGTNVTFDNRGDIRKSYNFSNGDFQFGD